MYVIILSYSYIFIILCYYIIILYILLVKNVMTHGHLYMHKFTAVIILKTQTKESTMIHNYRPKRSACEILTQCIYRYA